MIENAIVGMRNGEYWRRASWPIDYGVTIVDNKFIDKFGSEMYYLIMASVFSNDWVKCE